MNYDTVLSKRKPFEWIKTGLPQKYSYILCEDNYAFITEGRKIVSHGGLALEEVIVPFVHLKKL
jgi:hypothetical protein